MKAVLRLIAVYFTGTQAQRWTSLLSLILLMLGIPGLLRYSSMIFAGPESHLSNGSIAFSALLWMVPIVGVMALFFSGALMPIIFGHYAVARQLHMLPFGRARLLLSALVTLGVVAVMFAGVVVALYAPIPIDKGPVFARAMSISFLTFGMMYLLIWLISRAKGALTLLGGAMLIFPCFALPFHFIRIPQPPIGIPLLVGGLSIVAGAAAFLLAPRWSGSTLLARVTPPIWRPSLASEYQSGSEFAVLVAVARPWMLSIGLVFPVAVASLFVTSATIWLCYFMLCSVICGGISSLSVSRSRSLWLRGPWSRSELFAKLERLHWRQNAACLSVLLVLLVAIGSYLGFPAGLLAIGMPLLLAGAAVGTYLGLMMTRNIGWLDGVCAAGAMLLMLAMSMYATAMTIGLRVAVMSAITGLALAFRCLAQRRWAQLDWMLCRAPARAGN